MEQLSRLAPCTPAVYPYLCMLSLALSISLSLKLAEDAEDTKRRNSGIEWGWGEIGLLTLSGKKRRMGFCAGILCGRELLCALFCLGATALKGMFIPSDK